VKAATRTATSLGKALLDAINVNGGPHPVAGDRDRDNVREVEAKGAENTTSVTL
jgi:hypothetical protein